MSEQYSPPVTPVMVEQYMLKLQKENAEAYRMLRDAEFEFAKAHAALTVGTAKARLLARRTAGFDKTWLADDRVAYIVDQTEDLIQAEAFAEAQVKAARAHMQKIRTEVDLIRSIGTSVRVSMEAGG